MEISLIIIVLEFQYMAIGIPIAYNHFGYALARTLFGIYPYMKYYI